MISIDEFFNHVKLFDETFESKWDFGLRLGLIVEECGEWAQSVLKGHGIDKETEELCDLLYVVLGALHVRGSDIQKGMNAVMTKNQLKINNKSSMKISAEGKIIKPSDQKDMVPQVCTRVHKCTVEGPCNGFPRSY